ncbi:hypothetical protein ASPCAL06195 [Aspergillus calidoustus]|uniref:Uncharacterized protein n=1 Tax=Aspergillus calidoustus TaxID=454130 RepID=A0A0U5FZF1_ASPCI|nr:hypothetical protein ASPCAL06195 [Aspergillus calidoustus]
MFDLPDAKRIRRDDILSRDSSSSPSPPPDDTAYPDAQARLGALLNLDFTPTEPQESVPGTTQEDSKEQDDDEEQEFEFRLFSAPAPAESSSKEAPNGAAGTTESGAQKLRIRLRSPTPTTGTGGEGRFVKPFRGWSYYFTAPGLLSGEKGAGEDERIAAKRRQFEDVAVSGEEMRRLAGVPWPGCDLSWRVIRLKREHTKLPREEKGTKSSAITCVPEAAEREPLSHKKPGKKRRIQLRKRAAVAERAKETEAEKRNRKNREKKIKRRQKAREQKAAAAAGDPNSAAQEQGGDDSSESD